MRWFRETLDEWLFLKNLNPLSLDQEVILRSSWKTRPQLREENRIRIKSRQPGPKRQLKTADHLKSFALESVGEHRALRNYISH